MSLALHLYIFDKANYFPGKTVVCDCFGGVIIFVSYVLDLNISDKSNKANANG